MQRDRMPSQIKYIVGNEAAERFSFYGMTTILYPYMATMMVESQAESRYHSFVALVYFLGLFGGYLADRFLGKYRTIIYLSVVYCLGHAVLSATEGSEAGMYVGLVLIAIGAGGIKPCVSAHVGDQFSQSNKHLVDRAFHYFYWSINLGAFFSTILIPITKRELGWSVAFAIPGVLMAIATFVFWLGRHQYQYVEPTGKNPDSFLRVTMSMLGGRAAERHPAQAVEGVRAVFRVMALFVFVSGFWMLFHQQGSLWTAQAGQMDRKFFGYTLEDEQFQALNPLLIMVLVPLFTFFVYPWLGKRATPLRKMAVGMFLTGVAFVASALIQRQIAGSAPGSVSVAWQFFPYFIITVAEVLVSMTGLEFAYTQAPRAFKSTIMGIWLATVFVGNQAAAMVFASRPFEGAELFLFFAGLMAGAAVLFSLIALWYKPTEYIEADREPAAGKIPVVEAGPVSPGPAAGAGVVPPPHDGGDRLSPLP